MPSRRCINHNLGDFMSNNTSLVVSLDLMNDIVSLLLELPAKNSRALLNRIEKEVVPHNPPVNNEGGDIVVPSKNIDEAVPNGTV